MKKALAFLALVTLLFIKPVTVHAQTWANVTDSLALVDLYNSTNGPDWTNNTGWLVLPVSNWFGITEDASGRAIQITLYNNGLTGNIPAALSNLANLEVLNLESNQLTGGIPNELGNLTNLENLTLEGNQLSGSIPTELGNLTKLQTLDLQVNQLSGSVPTSLGNLKKLHYLYLGHNQLSGSIPTVFGNLYNLGWLGLDNNQLSGSIPTQIGNLLHLSDLDLDHNLLTGSIPTELGNLKKLQFLTLDDNLLSGSIPAGVANLILDYFELQNNYFTFDGMEAMALKYSYPSLYSPQFSILLHINNNKLSVSAGGTLSNNTYNWYNGSTKMATITGDSTYTPTVPGKYSVAITNAVAVLLTLYSDTITVTTPGNQPAITSFTPATAPVGATVTITGTNFTGASFLSFGGEPAASFNVVSPTAITAVVGNGQSGSVLLKGPGGTATLPGFTITPPAITSFTPTTATAGATVTITGTNFTGAAAVSFGGGAAESFTVVNSTTITAVVGPGKSGDVSVLTPGGRATLAGFTITPPAITSFTPATATAGTTVTITGNNFAGASFVAFGTQAAASFSVVNPTTITAVVGTGKPGYVLVITPGGRDSLAGFTIAPPTIASFSPASAPAGATVTITGNNFTGALAVSFGGRQATSYTVVSPTTITAVVGDGFSGSVSVTTKGGRASLPGFTIAPPAITSFTPASAPPGTPITITGTNFTGASFVSFGTRAATSFDVVSPTTITAVVGTGKTGNVLVITPGGTATLGGFTIIPPPIALPGPNAATGALTKYSTTNEGITARLYPNPATEATTLKLDGVNGLVTVTITDMAGKPVWRQDKVANGTYTLPLRNLAQGIYIVTIKERDAIMELKLVKAR